MTVSKCQTQESYSSQSIRLECLKQMNWIRALVSGLQSLENS